MLALKEIWAYIYWQAKHAGANINATAAGKNKCREHGLGIG